MSRIFLPRGTARRPLCLGEYQEHTPGHHQHRRSHVNACERNTQSSGTHDTPRSIQMDSHSVQASSALNNVTSRSRQRREPHDREYSFEKDRRCTDGLHTQCRVSVPRIDFHLCTCHTLDWEEDKGSSFRHQDVCTILHPLYLSKISENKHDMFLKESTILKYMFSCCLEAWANLATTAKLYFR